MASRKQTVITCIGLMLLERGNNRAYVEAHAKQLRKQRTEAVEAVYTAMLKRYAVISTDFGRHFSFLAEHDTDATRKLNNWLLYHGYFRDGIKENYRVEEISRDDARDDLHNEYVRTR